MLDELMMNFLTNKEESLQSLFKDIMKVQEHKKGLIQYLKNIDTCDMEEVDLRKKFKTMMSVAHEQEVVIEKLIMLMVVYMAGRNFDGDVATILTKLGKGEEALQAMFANKFKGKM